MKTHELPNDNAPAIYLVRDGRDALISYTHYILNVERASQSFETILQDIISNSRYFGGWGTHVMTWTRRPHPTAIIAVEPLRLIQKALPIVGKAGIEPLTLEPPPTFEQLQQEHPLLYHRGQQGYWKTEMPSHVHHLFWQIHGEAIRHMGYIARLAVMISVIEFFRPGM